MFGALRNLDAEHFRRVFRASRTFDAERFLARALRLCSLAGVVTALGHRVHPGVDLPNHTYVISVLSRLALGDADLATFYRMNLGTPYVLAYLFAIPLVPAFGAAGAVKILLACAAASAPWAMTSWLRAIGGEPLLGVFGVLLVFAFPYQWGFLSHIAAIPILFWYLAAFERQGLAPSFRAMGTAFGLGLMLFLCHGISFGLAMLIVGARCLVPFRPRVILMRSAHLLPISALVVAWLFSRRGQVGMFADWPSPTRRLVWLFSSPFVPGPEPSWATLGVSVFVIGVAVAWPRLGKNAAQWLPVFTSLILYATLPEWIAATWLVGSRFAAYIHAFVPGVFAPGPTAARRFRMGWVALAATLAGLVFQNVRLWHYGRELEGLLRLAERAPHGVDVRTSLPIENANSESFGLAQYRYAGAHVAARNGGILLEDFSTALQMPLQRQPSPPFPTEFRVLVDRGDEAQATARARALTDSARLFARDGPWLLFVADERRIANGEITILHLSQGWGKPELNRSVTGGPLVVANNTYAEGLGVHANSYIRARVPRNGRLSGAAGVDTRGWPSTRIAFEIRSGSGSVLFQSGPLSRDNAAVPFSVHVDQQAGLVLEAFMACDCFQGAHADWLALRFEPGD